MTKQVLFSFFLMGALAGCSVPQKPKVTNDKKLSPSTDHTNFTADCSECHEDTRPAATDNVEHGFGRDCAECHEYTTTKIWTPIAYSHSPAPTACLGCHAADRSTAATHPGKTGECAPCHTYPQWKAATTTP
ncbi:MAG: hypothetical protein AB7T49_07005 [Oligoflexales bacterium]